MKSFIMGLNSYLILSVYSIGLLLSCTCIERKISVKGNLAVYDIETTVDSMVAKYFLENYLAGKKTDTLLDDKIAQLINTYKNALPTQNDLAQISAEYSVDFAALFWAWQVLQQKENKLVQKKFLAAMDEIEANEGENWQYDHLVILVPGLDYEEHGHATGADLGQARKILSKIGMPTLFVRIPAIGPVEKNASMIADVIKKTRFRKVIIAGPSSAGPAIHYALSQGLPLAQAKKVLAWLNLGGIVKGSPLVDWADSGFTCPLWRLVLWNKGWEYAAFASLSQEIREPQFKKMQLPNHIKVFNYIGLSLSGDISRFSEDKYCILKSAGPNDGLAYLPDMLIPRSYTIIAPTSDHFFAEDPEIDLKTLALLKTIMNFI